MSKAPDSCCFIADTLASELLLRHEVKRIPVPVTRIAENEGASVRYARLLADAKLSCNSSKYVITVNELSNVRRQRFSIAHELGHLLLDRYRCSPSHKSNDYLNVTFDAREEERFCNKFASRLLIPKDSIVGIDSWENITIGNLRKKAYELDTSMQSLVWRILEQIADPGGSIFFRFMGKPTEPDDVRLRIDWGVFPNSNKVYLPRYAAVPTDSPIYKAMRKTGEQVLDNVKLDFGNLHSSHALIIGWVGNGLLAIILPNEVRPHDAAEHETLPGC